MIINQQLDDCPARVTVSAGTVVQIDQVRGGGSYNSSNDTRLHFGLGSSATTNKIQVRWPSGRKQESQNIPADAIYEINEESGLHKITPLAAPSN